MALEVGAKAPMFTLPDDKGNKFALKDYKGKKIILFFYPKDMTPGCTTEACDFRDNLSRLKRKKCVVLGVSKDSVARHEKFRDKYELNFPLLSDEEGKVCEKYDVWQEKKLYGKTFMGIVRTTYIIDEKGKISHAYEKVKVKGHVDQIIEDLSS
ncbi:MAG: thioredoxin-dependent thiol peroxidase [Oligoflexales bacterium]|nr:thioredoxin-dependent thiol peroxidase [Oligoflexales bacterium]